MFRSDSRSLFHDHPHPRHHHGPSLFGIALSRLRPALYYFILAVVITTFFYCLFFYDSDSSRYHPHRRFRGHYGKASALISTKGDGLDSDDTVGVHKSASVLLEEFIRKANLHFVDNYARKITLVPTLLDNDGLALTALVDPNNSDPQHHQRNLLENFRYETVRNTSNNTQSQQNESAIHIRLLGDENSPSQPEDDDLLTDEDEDYLEQVDNPDSVEHYLELLGFNIRHITRYLLHANQSNVNVTRQTKKAVTKILNTSKLLTPLPANSISSQNNISSISDLLDLLSGVYDSTDGSNVLIFVSAINSNQYSMAYHFIKSFERYRKASAKDSGTTSPMHLRLMIYDLGLNEDQLFEV